MDNPSHIGRNMDSYLATPFLRFITALMAGIGQTLAPAKGGIIKVGC